MAGAVHSLRYAACATHWCQAVYLIKEDDGGLLPLSLLKQQAQLALSLAHPLGQDVSALWGSKAGRQVESIRRGLETDGRDLQGASCMHDAGRLIVLAREHVMGSSALVSV